MSEKDTKRKNEFFKALQYDVEHALGMHAYSFVQMPASGLYDENALGKYREILERCHIYLVGYLPKMDFVGAKQDGRTLITSLSVLGEVYEVKWDLPEGCDLRVEAGLHYVIAPHGQRCFPNTARMMSALHEKTRKLNFDVQYIGQAYGQEGERNAVDRLLKHETLQKIALTGVPEGHNLELLLLEVAPANTVFTMFNPHAKDATEGEQRISAGLDKLFGTDERERIALYEASLIRYFKPRFNKEFKDSFPSTNLKILQDCYDKDFSAVIAEICIDELPYYLCSREIQPKPYHIAQHDLHDEDQRKAFFSM